MIQNEYFLKQLSVSAEVKMETFLKNGNETIFPNQLTAIMTFISLISNQFHVESFTVMSEMEVNSFVNFQKIASEYSIKTSSNRITDEVQVDEERSYLIMTNSQVDFPKITSTRPKLIASIYFTEEEYLATPQFMSELVIPASTNFFLVKFTRGDGSLISTSTEGKFFKLYKPTPFTPSKIFPMMAYGANRTWTWETPGMDWNYFRKYLRDMRGLTVNIGIVSYTDRNTTIKNFLENRQSFFWRTLKEHLGFTLNIHTEIISAKSVKSVTRIYVKLVMTKVEGLGILPVISSERNQYVDYIVTGLDSKFHLMVRTPQYVHSWQSVFKPFTSQSWLCLGLAIILIAVTLRIVTFNQNVTDFSSCFLTVIGFVCCQSSADIPQNLPGRLVCFTGLVFSHSVYQFYISNFYSLLSTKEASLPFTSLEQLLTKRTHNLYVHPETAIYSQITNAKNGTFKRIWSEILQNDPTHQLKTATRAKALKRVCKGKGAILGLPFQTTNLRELKCELVSVNTGIFPTNIVTVVRKRFPFKSQFKFVHLRLLEGGISHKFRDKYLEGDLMRPTKSNVINEPISLEHVAFLFAFYAVSLVLSLIILGIEIIGSRKFFKLFKKLQTSFKKTKKNKFQTVRRGIDSL